VGDNPVPNKGLTETEIAVQCGFINASYGHFTNINQRPRKVIKKHGLLKSVHVSGEVLDCDIFISLPKFRSHELTLLSIAVKNSFGIIPGNIKPAIHANFPKIDDFCRVLVEIYAIRTPDLIIVDVLSCIDAHGKKYQPGFLVCGTNGHAIDYVCARIVEVDPLRIPTLRLASDMGLFDPSTLVIDGELPVLHSFQTPLAFPFRGAIVQFFAQWLYQLWLKRRPYIDRAHCTGCGACEEVCPAKAIRGRTIDHARCIRCFCCFEVCPHNALHTRIKL
jgi:Pyruvate/2-oxoacid:ferredoxin oxidoreductase delta subunit